MGRQDSQNGPVRGPEPGNPQPGRAAVPPRPPTGTTYGRASVPPGSPHPTGTPSHPARPYPPNPAAGAYPPNPSNHPNYPYAAGPGFPSPAPPPVPTTATTPRPTTAEPPRRPTRRRALWVLGVLVTLLALATATLVIRPGPVKRLLGSSPAASTTGIVRPEPTPTPVLMAAEGGGALPSTAAIKAALDPLVKARALGGEVNMSVVDATTGEPLYQRNPDTMSTPASTTKLLTATAALAARGPAYRLSTRAVAGSKPGEVVLVGGGDPTLSINATGQFPGAARLDLLAAQVKRAMGGVKPTRVVIDTSLFTGPETALGWSPSDISPGGQVARIQALMTNSGRITPVHHEVGADPRFPDPAIAAGKAFAKQLGVTAAVTRGRAPSMANPGASAQAGDLAPGTPLGVVQSPPLVEVIDWMLQQSDNVIAEAMGRQVALALGKPATFDGATEAIIAKLNDLGLPADEADLYDASGLSRHNGISPALLTDVLTLAASGKVPAVASLFVGLPVAGWSGTMETRFVTPSPNQIAEGIVRAKTGSLSGVNTMAGELITHDGRLLVFAIMAKGSSDTLAARGALDRVVARLVACGCG